MLTRHHARDVRVVDRFGLVACPRRGRDVPVETCLACRELVTVDRDDHDRITQLRCHAAADGWHPDQPPHPFGLLGPIGPWRW